jgi:hypothetical protein
MYRIMLLLFLLVPSWANAAFDHSHAAWDALLKKHVQLINGGVASQLDYSSVQRDHAALKAYTDALGQVGQTKFDGWSKDQQLAFLINAYNAYTVELVLSAYPKLKSIRDLGGLFGSPWKKQFFKLFGQPAHLDHIEHDLIRAPGRYAEPRIHFAVVCASIGCPELREEAFVAGKLDAQIEDAMRRFLSDRSRNRYNATKDRLEVSKIFDWYSEDFERGDKGFTSVSQALGRYAGQLADDPQTYERIRSGQVEIDFLGYDCGASTTSAPSAERATCAT